MALAAPIGRRCLTVLHFKGTVERNALLRFAVLVTVTANGDLIAVCVRNGTGSDGDLCLYNAAVWDEGRDFRK